MELKNRDIIDLIRFFLLKDRIDFNYYNGTNITDMCKKYNIIVKLTHINSPKTMFKCEWYLLINKH